MVNSPQSTAPANPLQSTAPANSLQSAPLIDEAPDVWTAAANRRAAVARAAQTARERTRTGYTSEDYRFELKRSKRMRRIGWFVLVLVAIAVVLVAVYAALRAMGVIGPIFPLP